MVPVAAGESVTGSPLLPAAAPLRSPPVGEPVRRRRPRRMRMVPNLVEQIYGLVTLFAGEVLRIDRRRLEQLLTARRRCSAPRDLSPSVSSLPLCDSGGAGRRASGARAASRAYWRGTIAGACRRRQLAARGQRRGGVGDAAARAR